MFEKLKNIGFGKKPEEKKNLKKDSEKKLNSFDSLYLGEESEREENKIKKEEIASPKKESEENEKEPKKIKETLQPDESKEEKLSEDAEIKKQEIEELKSKIRKIEKKPRLTEDDEKIVLEAEDKIRKLEAAIKSGKAVEEIKKEIGSEAKIETETKSELETKEEPIEEGEKESEPEVETKIEPEKEELKKEPDKEVEKAVAKKEIKESGALAPEEKKEIQKMMDELKQMRHSAAIISAKNKWALSADYLEARTELFKKLCEIYRRKGLEEERVNAKAARLILLEQKRFIKERENIQDEISPLWKRGLRRLLGNKIMKAYLKIPRQYRWVGFSALGAAVLFSGGAGLAAASAYFGYKLSRYIVGAITSAGAMKAVEAYEKYYGTKKGKEFDRKIMEGIGDKITIEEMMYDKLKETDIQLEEMLGFKKKVNIAKALAGVAGFFAGYELTDIFVGSSGILEAVSAKGVVGEGGGVVGHAHEKIIERTNQANQATVTENVLNHQQAMVEQANQATITENVLNHQQVLAEHLNAENVYHIFKSSENLAEVAKHGDSIWKMSERILASKLGSQWEKLTDFQKTYLVDAIKDKIVANPEKFGLHGVTNPDTIQPGVKIDFSSLLKDEKFINHIFSNLEKIKK